MVDGHGLFFCNSKASMSSSQNSLHPKTLDSCHTFEASSYFIDSCLNLKLTKSERFWAFNNESWPLMAIKKRPFQYAKIRNWDHTPDSENVLITGLSFFV
jgi:hypothetical protein